jgi:hypothetical protein
LYIDEAEDYANRKLGDVLDKKRNLGLRLVFAHHTFAQFEDKRVESSIVSNAKFKVAFYVGAEDRERLVKMLGYGGELKDRDIVYQLGKLKRQEAVIRNNKQPPQIIKIENVEPVKVSKKKPNKKKRSPLIEAGFSNTSEQPAYRYCWTQYQDTPIYPLNRMQPVQFLPTFLLIHVSVYNTFPSPVLLRV